MENFLRDVYHYIRLQKEMSNVIFMELEKENKTVKAVP